MSVKEAYIIMPVDSDREFEMKRSTIEVSLRKKNWSALFPSSTTDRAKIVNRQGENAGFILSDMIAKMKSSSLVVADLSLERPSCYYELGVAQAIGCPTFLIAAAGSQIHQVANRGQIHFYSEMRELSTLMDEAFS